MTKLVHNTKSSLAEEAKQYVPKIRELYPNLDNMDTKDLVNYVMDDLDRYYEKMSDADFLEDAYNYWEDSFDEVVEDIKEYTDCKFKKDRRED